MPIEGKEVRFATQIARNSMRWITGFFLLLFAVYGADRYIHEAKLEAVNKNLLTLEALSGKILAADEKLTMSAMAFAMRGGDEWRLAYEAQVPIINTAIADVIKLATPESAAAFDAATRVSNDRLIEYETQAFAYAKNRDFARAIERMRSTHYAYHKLTLERGTSALVSAVKSEYQANLSRMLNISKAILAGLLFVGAVSFAFMWRRLSKALKASEDAFAATEHIIREELATAQVQLLRQSKLTHLGQLTATVAHELRNPLGAVRTSAFVIERKYLQNNPDMAAPLKRIKAAILRSDTIITQLLDFARNTPPVKKPASLDDWLETVLLEQAETLPNSISLSCDLGLAGQQVDFDGDRLRRVIINLMNNASEAMVGRVTSPLATQTSNPTIDISTRLTSRGAEIRFQDNGPGMSADVLAKIFEPLFSTKSFGTGLGLPAIQKIMEQHAGGLEVSSVEGQGATFTAWLPIVSEDTSREAA